MTHIAPHATERSYSIYYSKFSACSAIPIVGIFPSLCLAVLASLEMSLSALSLLTISALTIGSLGYIGDCKKALLQSLACLVEGWSWMAIHTANIMSLGMLTGFVIGGTMFSVVNKGFHQAINYLQENQQPIAAVVSNLAPQAEMELNAYIEKIWTKAPGFLKWLDSAHELFAVLQQTLKPAVVAPMNVQSAVMTYLLAFFINYKVAKVKEPKDFIALIIAEIQRHRQVIDQLKTNLPAPAQLSLSAIISTIWNQLPQTVQALPEAHTLLDICRNMLSSPESSHYQAALPCTQRVLEQ